MKNKLFVSSVMLFLISMGVQYSVAQVPGTGRSRTVLDEANTLKLRQLPSQKAPDSLLARRGFKLYKGKDLAGKMNLNAGKLSKFTLRELNERNKNNGLLPLMTPLFFQQNIGQSKNDVKYILQNTGSIVGLNDNGLFLAVQKGLLDDEIKPDSATTNADKLSLKFLKGKGTLAARKPVGAQVNSCKGNNPANWIKKIPAFNYIVNDELYPGIRLGYQALLGRLEYQFMLAPNANVSQIRIAVAGSRKLSIDKRGNLLMETPGGTIVQTAPRCYEMVNEKRLAVKGRFVLFNDNEYGFTVQRQRPNTSLVIDPEIVFTSYFGGSGNDAMLGADAGANDFIGRGFDIKIGSTGEVFVIGKTFSADFPVTDATTLKGSGDIFVMKLDPSQPLGSVLVYATLVGGTSDENARSIEAMSDGSAYITGWSASSDFPTTSGVVQPTRANSGAYVAKLDPAGLVVLGTFIGKARSNHPNSIVFNQEDGAPEGFIYVGGSTQLNSGSDSTAGSFQTTFAGGTFDGFLTKLNLSLTNYVYFTYLGGSGTDVIMDIDVVDGFLFATGMTASTDFPTTEIAFQRHHSEASGCTGTIGSSRVCAEAFVTRLNVAGNGLLYSTYLGEAGKEDYARGIAVNASRQAYVTGAIASGDVSEVFVAKFEGGGENILWKRKIPGISRDHGEELVVDAFDRAHVTGTFSVDGQSNGFGAQTFHGGRSDIFYSRLNAAGEIEFFTYLGGSAEDRGFSVAAMGSSPEEFCAFIAGSSVSDDIETIAPLAGGETRKGNADLLLYAICNIQFNPDASSFFKTGPIEVQMGQSFTYTINVNNAGDVAAPVVVSDNVPAPLTVTGVSGTGCTRTGNNINCSFSAQPGGNPILITVSVPAPANRNNCTSRSVTNTATIRVGSRTFSSSATTRLNCPPPLCGNGRLDPGEACDGGANCRSNCTIRRCGDGIVDPGEQCDNGRANCVNCRIILEEGDECGAGITGSCPPGTRCQTLCFPISCEYDWTNLWGLLADDNCGDMLCRTYRECAED